MSLYGLIFYVIAASIVFSTVLAVTRRNLVHAVVYLILSYFGTAMLFYLFGAPLLAALEVIIYAGAIMVLFLFVVMMIKMESSKEVMFPIGQWVPAAILGMIYVGTAFLLSFTAPGAEAHLSLLWAAPREFSLYVFQNHWFLIEVVSLLLLVALIGVVVLAKGRGERQAERGT